MKAGYCRKEQEAAAVKAGYYRKEQEAARRGRRCDEEVLQKTCVGTEHIDVRDRAWSDGFDDKIPGGGYPGGEGSEA